MCLNLVITQINESSQAAHITQQYLRQYSTIQNLHARYKQGQPAVQNTQIAAQNSQIFTVGGNHMMKLPYKQWPLNSSLVEHLHHQ